MSNTSENARFFSCILLVDAVEVLFAPGDGGLDLAVLELLLHRDPDLVDQFAAVAARRLDRLGQHLVAVGVAVAEAQVFQFLVDRVQPQPVGDRARRFPAFRVAMRWRFSAGIASMVCMLCRRSASLIRITRTSCAIASSILRKFSACACCFGLRTRACRAWRRHRPASATALPKRASISPAVAGGVFHHVVQQRGASGSARRDASRRGCRRRQAGGRCRVRRFCGTGLRGRCG